MTTQSEELDDLYQALQGIYLDWHDGRRPLSGYIRAIQALLATTSREARIDELKTLIDENDAEEAAICHFGQGMHKEDEECFQEYGRAAGVTQILDVARAQLQQLTQPNQEPSA